MHYTGNYWSNLNGTVNGQNNLGQKTVSKILKCASGPNFFFVHALTVELASCWRAALAIKPKMLKVKLTLMLQSLLKGVKTLH